MNVTILLVPVLALAVYSDLRARRISNALVVGALVAAIAVNASLNGWQGVLTSAAGAVVGLATLLPLYALRGMGAGDVKLMAAVGGFVGPFAALWTAVWALMAGGVIAVGLVAWRVVQQPGVPALAAVCLPPLWRSTFAQVRHERFPFAVAIAAGALVALFIRGTSS